MLCPATLPNGSLYFLVVNQQISKKVTKPMKKIFKNLMHFIFKEDMTQLFTYSLLKHLFNIYVPLTLFLERLSWKDNT